MYGLQLSVLLSMSKHEWKPSLSCPQPPSLEEACANANAENTAKTKVKITFFHN